MSWSCERYIPEMDWRIHFIFFFVKECPSIAAFSFSVDTLSFLNLWVKLGDKSDKPKDNGLRIRLLD